MMTMFQQSVCCFLRFGPVFVQNCAVSSSPLIHNIVRNIVIVYCYVENGNVYPHT